MDYYSTKLSNLLLFSLLVFSQLTPSYSYYGDPYYVSVHPDDEKVLVQIQKQLGNNAQPWMTDDYYDIECCIYDNCDNSQPLVCDYDHRVKMLTLTFDYPTRSRPVIPTALGDLAFLTSLTLSGRYFTSPIPGRALRKLTNLTSLSIHSTRIIGPIPGSLFGMQNLISLNLTNNKFITGGIPKALTKLTSLDKLDLSSNRLSGPIPSFLGRMSNLRWINLKSNRFSGSIPAFPNLSYVDLSHNQLTGSIPNNVGSLTDVLTVKLNNNRLTGSIPRAMAQAEILEIDVSNNKLTDASTLFLSQNNYFYIDSINLSNNRLKFNFSNANVPQLISLNISHNMIYGPLLKPLGKLYELDSIDVSYNQLCGPIPANLVGFIPTNFAHNKCLCGAPLPPCK